MSWRLWPTSLWLSPVNGIVEVGGPERLPLDELVRRYFAATKDTRQVIADVRARYFGTELTDQSLTAGAEAVIGATRFDDWLRLATAPK